jgi:NAD(P)H-nitrite reductase large subunit
MKHLILGNGPAGVVAAETLRCNDAQCEILLAGSEDAPPYSRMAIPYLLQENIDEQGTYLRKSPDHYDRLGIRQLLGRAVSLDITMRQVLFQDGHSENYDCLLIATGSHPIRPPIPGIDLPHVHTCWTLEDARAIASLTKPETRVLQLGAGFIGCIIMEALAIRGVELTVVEMGDRMVPRMMTPTAGDIIKRWVENKGVRVHTSVEVERIAQSDRGAPLRASLSTGETLECDLVIVAAGVAPNMGFLEGTPVHLGKGVLVNHAMQTSVPEIYAAGDVAEAPDLFTDARLVSAIQPNATDQAQVAAINMAGGKSRLKGVLAINILDTLGLISTSFGQWWGVEENKGGSGVELVDEAAFRYLSLQFHEDLLVGATSIGWSEHVGVLRGLIQAQVRLGKRKQELMRNPTRFMAAYLGAIQAVA